MFTDIHINEQTKHELAALMLGLIVGYLCVILSIELELYIYRSRFVVDRLYSMFREAESVVEKETISR
jgi:hypothetical protein